MKTQIKRVRRQPFTHAEDIATARRIAAGIAPITTGVSTKFITFPYPRIINTFSCPATSTLAAIAPTAANSPGAPFFAAVKNANSNPSFVRSTRCDSANGKFCPELVSVLAHWYSASHSAVSSHVGGSFAVPSWMPSSSSFASDALATHRARVLTSAPARRRLRASTRVAGALRARVVVASDIARVRVRSRCDAMRCDALRCDRRRATPSRALDRTRATMLAAEATLAMRSTPPPRAAPRRAGAPRSAPASTLSNRRSTRVVVAARRGATHATRGVSLNDVDYASASTHVAHARAIAQTAELEGGIQAFYLGTLLAILGGAGFIVVRQVLIRRELDDQAKKMGERIRAGNASAEDYFEMGSILLRKKVFTQAVRNLQAAEANWDGDEQDLALVHNALGFGYSNTDKIDDAIAEFKKSVALQPGYVTAWNNLGEAYEKKKELKEAIKCYEESLVLSPNNPTASERLEEITLRLRRRGQLD